MLKWLVAIEILETRNGSFCKAIVLYKAIIPSVGAYCSVQKCMFGKQATVQKDEVSNQSVKERWKVDEYIHV